ncbi:hypothetical protein STZ1_10605 [Bacillus subtilis]
MTLTEKFSKHESGKIDQTIKAPLIKTEGGIEGGKRLRKT